MKKTLFAIVMLFVVTQVSAYWFIDSYGLVRSNICRSQMFWSPMPFYGIVGTQCHFYNTNGQIFYGVFSRE